MYEMTSMMAEFEQRVRMRGWKRIVGNVGHRSPQWKSFAQLMIIYWSYIHYIHQAFQVDLGLVWWAVSYITHNALLIVVQWELTLASSLPTEKDAAALYSESVQLCLPKSFYAFMYIYIFFQYFEFYTWFIFAWLFIFKFIFAFLLEYTRATS